MKRMPPEVIIKMKIETFGTKQMTVKEEDKKLPQKRNKARSPLIPRLVPYKPVK